MKTKQIEDKSDSNQPTEASKALVTNKIWGYILTGLLVLIAVGIGNYFLSQNLIDRSLTQAQLSFNAANKQQMTMLLATIEQQAALISELQVSQAEIQQSMLTRQQAAAQDNTIFERIALLEDKLQTTEQAPSAEFMPILDKLRLESIRDILILVENQLRLGHATKQQLQLSLEQVDTLITKITSLDTMNLIQKWQVFNANLEQQTALLGVNLSNQLHHLMLKTANLPTKLPFMGKRIAQSSEPLEEVQPGWRGYWQRAKRQLKQLIRVRDDETIVSQVDAAWQTRISRAELQLALVEMHVAILQRQQTFFDCAFSRVTQLINENFDTSQTLTQQFAQKIQGFKTLELNHNTSALSEVHQAIMALNGELTE